MIHDGQGHPAGQRPGVLFSDANAQAERARVDPYAEFGSTVGLVADAALPNVCHTATEKKASNGTQAARAVKAVIC